MNGRLLTNEQYTDIAGLTTIPELVTYLKSNPSYAPLFSNINDRDIHRIDLEKILSNSLYSDFTRLYKFADFKQKQFLDLYFLRYEIAIVKECLCSVFDEKSEPLHISQFHSFFNSHSKIDVLILATAPTISEFIEGLKESDLYQIFTQLSQYPNASLLDYEMHLDLYYFTQFWKNRKKFLSGNDLEAITRIYGRKIDLLNIQWIIRAKKNFQLTPAEIYSFIIPIQYKLKKQEFSLLVEADSLDTVSSVIRNCYYGKHIEQLDTHTVEDTYLSLQHQLNDKSAKNHPYSVAIINSYLYNKERERNRLITAIECIRYRMDFDTTLAYITK